MISFQLVLSNWWKVFEESKTLHTSSVERFSENFDQEAVIYLIFFVGMHWFQKCNFWKNSLSPFWGRKGCWGQMTLRLKITKILSENPLKIYEIQNLASVTSKMASWPWGSQKRLSEFFQNIRFSDQGKALRKMSYSPASWSNFENYQFLTLCPRGRQENVENRLF